MDQILLHQQFWTKIFVGQNIFLGENFWGQNIFWTKFLDKKLFWVKHFYQPNSFCLSLFWTNSCWTKLFFNIFLFYQIFTIELKPSLLLLVHIFLQPCDRPIFLFDFSLMGRALNSIDLPFKCARCPQHPCRQG